MSDYLWDRSGEPDPEVERLEKLLSGLRHQDGPLQFPITELEPVRTRRWLAWLTWKPIAVATAVLLLLGGGWWIRHRSMASPSWDVAALQGAPRIGKNPVRKSGRLRVGQWLETDAASRAEIRVENVGSVEIEPQTRLGLLATASDEHRMSLERGKIQARIWAPPGQFFVHTPSAVAVDLGCAYTLEVDDRGAGKVRVTIGWVGFEKDGRESFIPAGAMCVTRPGVGPGTPYYEDASVKLRAALESLDFQNGGSPALTDVLAEAREKDALTLWHLLSRVPAQDRVRVFDRLAAFIPPPLGVTRPGILSGDPVMLDLWWNELGLGDVSWWRLWKRTWPR